MDYRRFCTTAWKASNYLRHLGVGGGRGVAVLADHSPPPLLTFFGAALLDVPTCFAETVDDLPASIDAVDARAVLVSSEHESEVEPPAGTTLVVHGDDPEAATTENWEAGVWSENPAFVPSSATPESAALVTVDDEVSHGALLRAGRTVVENLGLDAEATVALRASLADPRAVAAGVVAPLLAGAAARLGAGPATVTVGGGDAELSLDAVTVSE